MPLISITGPIATGATTLAKLMCNQTSWKPMFEGNVVEDNPFFLKYQELPSVYSFHNQTLFLTRSASLHKGLRQEMNYRRIFVQDFTPFEHNDIYTNVLFKFNKLSRDEFELLSNLNEHLKSYFVLPDVLVYRGLDSRKLKERVFLRGRQGEDSYKFEFLDAIRERFEEWSSTWSQSRIIKIRSDVDLLTDFDYVNDIIREVEDYLNFRYKNSRDQILFT
ncbi:MAG: deoxynucleoside kinase [Bacteroidota bacterium]